jgi:hypothetical protein
MGIVDRLAEYQRDCTAQKVNKQVEVNDFPL